MNILLDTCTFLWLVSDGPELSDTARRLFADPDNDVCLSVASAWEIIVKHNPGKLPLPEPATTSSRTTSSAIASRRSPWMKQPFSYSPAFRNTTRTPSTASSSARPLPEA